ncbi:MAG: Fe-S cluster assembly protein SufD [Bacteroidetes bacterium]|nr:Fe-S cluster assembly protein SufD [Bacteroidota bacterium]
MAIKKEIDSAKEWYLNGFEEFKSKLNGQTKTFFTELRNDAIDQLGKINFPTSKDEEWKYTNVSPLLKNNFIPANLINHSIVDSTAVNSKIFKGFDSYLLVFVNGVYNSNLSNIAELPEGIVVDSFNNVLKTKPELIEKHVRAFSKTNNAFDALNTAFTTDGLVVILPEGKTLEKPIQALYLNGNNENTVLSSPRNLIVAGKNSQVSIIANYQAVSENPYFSNITTEVFADESSVVDLYKIQNESMKAFHIERVETYQNKKSVFSHYNISFGGRLVRNDINTKLDDEFIETHYYGLYLGSKDQHIDNHTYMDHAKPNCESNEIYKGILDDSSRGVFNGKIMVRKDAQKTNAYQSNKTVLLSKEAKIDTKPQLEIYADDVKCSHGATVGHLDDTAYFYIRSRGIPADLAKSILIRAFVSDVVETLKIEELREQINHLIFEHLHRVEI